MPPDLRLTKAGVTPHGLFYLVFDKPATGSYPGLSFGGRYEIPSHFLPRLQRAHDGGRRSLKGCLALHEQIGDPELAHAFWTGRVHNAHRIEMRDDSMRKSRGKANP